MTLSKLDYQQHIRAFITRVERKRRIDLGNPPEVSKYPQQFFACGADFRSVEFHDFPPLVYKWLRNKDGEVGRG